MQDLDMNRISRYPFLEISRKKVGDMGLTLQHMLSPENSKIIDRAVERIEEAIEGKEIEPDTRRILAEVETDLLSYPISRFLVAAVGEKHLVKWFSHHEGERAHSHLRGEEMEMVLEIGDELGLPSCQPPPGHEERAIGRKRYENVRLKLHKERNPDDARIIWIGFPDYLQSRRSITGPKWDLVNRRVVSGLVGIEKESYIRLIQERVREKVEEGLLEKPPVPGNRELKERIKIIKQKVSERMKRYSPTDLGRMSITRLPPCMRQLLGMSQAGENIPHHGRFALVTFLNAIGMSSEEIFKIFTSSPDFKEDIVRYQVEHITGGGSDTSYHVPNCETMKSGGVCFNPDGLCDKEWLNSPMYYYKLKGKKRNRHEGSK